MPHRCLNRSTDLVRHPALLRKSGMIYTLLPCILLLGLLLNACSLTTTTGQISTSTHQQNGQTSTGASNRPVTYSTDPHVVLIRTFDGGGEYGSLAFAPQLSIYGDGSYVLGQEQQGYLAQQTLQHLLSTLVDTDALLQFKRFQFSDISDQNSTFLELNINATRQEFMYGSFGNESENPVDMNAYQRLGSALTSIATTLTGPTHLYSSNTAALLVRQTFSANTNNLPSFSIPDLSLPQIATYECGAIPPDDDPNKESPCLKYTIPTAALLLQDTQLQRLENVLNGASHADFSSQGENFTVTIRHLLPDELVNLQLAMFGSNQTTYKAVPLHAPPVPTT